MLDALLNLSDDLDLSEVRVAAEEEDSVEVVITAEDLQKLPHLTTSVRQHCPSLRFVVHVLLIEILLYNFRWTPAAAKMALR